MTMRAGLLATFERLHTIDELIPPSRSRPGRRMPSGRWTRYQSLDQSFDELAAQSPLGDATSKAASGIADRAHSVESAIGGIVDALDGAQARLPRRAPDVASLAGNLNLAITLLALIIALGSCTSRSSNWLLLHP